MMSLLRLLDIVSGDILIDDINILNIGLHDLRNRIVVIPQDPLLFSGTLRSNLDPFGRYTDSELWGVIRKCDLSDAVSKNPAGLEMSVMER
jgi:ABC-type multidrug transport system fused ATPase/permease subunit